jgi:D-alanine-D-alanine ligase
MHREGGVFLHITVLYGGVGEEREVSLRSGECVLRALAAQGAQVSGVMLDAPFPDATILRELGETDAVFLALHGGAGENGELQDHLESHGIFHYTGTGIAASALAMDKARARDAVRAVGVPVASGVVSTLKTTEPPMPYPFVVKPLRGGSSVGVVLVRAAWEWENCTPSVPFLCEEYLTGREFSVAVLGGRCLPPIEICPRGGFYDYAHKYTAGATEEICPAPMPLPRRAALQDLALLCFDALGLRDYGRIDFKESAYGELCFLEANTLPGMTECSLMPLAASRAGMTLGALALDMARAAMARKV